MFIVYETTCLVNNKKYIGVHQQEADDDYIGSGKHFLRAVRKYGKDKFVRKTLHTFETRQEAYNMESKLVGEKEVMSPEYYNMVPGGKGGNIWTDKEATCQKMRDNWNRSPERIHRLRTQNIGRSLSEDHKNRLHQAAIEKNSIVYDIHRGDEYIGSFTLKEFCARINGNLPSCRQGVWNRGAYKGYTFTAHNTSQCLGSL